MHLYWNGCILYHAIISLYSICQYQSKYASIKIKSKHHIVVDSTESKILIFAQCLQNSRSVDICIYLLTAVMRLSRKQPSTKKKHLSMNMESDRTGHIMLIQSSFYLLFGIIYVSKQQ